MSLTAYAFEGDGDTEGDADVNERAEQGCFSVTVGILALLVSALLNKFTEEMLVEAFPEQNWHRGIGYGAITLAAIVCLFSLQFPKTCPFLEPCVKRCCRRRDPSHSAITGEGQTTSKARAKAKAKVDAAGSVVEMADGSKTFLRPIGTARVRKPP